ncbi:hypothetical protein KP509_16G065400 [Ceratopteris richardii]|uniref:Eukaryotic translation initiation factor 4 gamma 2 n=1 Tax=Ceratopteris richardii TaxID=49495 RepID=A0A8T2T1G2_CERRI|nr:hypothetical protein KP509_16G065400 [Ceratopteris richardii]
MPKPEPAWNTTTPQLSFQFGSIGPLVQMPVRTSSAPPNLDEQKQDLLQFESVRAQIAKSSIPSGGLNQTPRSQAQQTGMHSQSHSVNAPIPTRGLQQVPSSQGQQTAAPASTSTPHSPYHQQRQQQPVSLQGSQPSMHMQACSAVTTQTHMPMQAHMIPQAQQGLVQLSYPQHVMQPQLQHNGGQVVKYPQSIGGSPAMGPSLTVLPGQMAATQIGHQLPGGLAPGIPGAPYGFVSTNNPFIPPRTSSAVKIVHPETHEEIKFDYKVTKFDNVYDNVPVSAPVAEGSSVRNGPLNTRPPSSHADVDHHENLYLGQQAASQSTGMQHYHQSHVPARISSKQASAAESFSSNTISTVSTSSVATSKEIVAGLSTAEAPVVPGTATGVMLSVESGASKEQELPPLSSVESTNQVHESEVEVNNQSVRTQRQELSSEHLKDTTRVVKDSTSISIDVRYSNKKKKKKDGSARASTGDVQKVYKAQESKKHCEMVSDAQKVRTGTSNSAEAAQGSTESGSVRVETVPENVSVAPDVAHYCNGELATDIQQALIDAAADHDFTSESTKEALRDEVVSSNLSSVDVGFHVNTVHKGLIPKSDLNSIEHNERENDISTVHSKSLNLLNLGDTAYSDLSSKVTLVSNLGQSSHVTQSQGKTTELKIETNEGPSEVPEVKVHHETAVLEEIISESSSITRSHKEEEDLQDQLAIETHSNVQSLLSSVPVSQDTPPLAVPNVKPGGKKKKMKVILAKADAAGTTSDLYNAYKSPQVKKQDVVMPSNIDSTKCSTSDVSKKVVTRKDTSTSKELDDWEDAVELPTPKAPPAGDTDSKSGAKSGLKKGGETYSRDFLLTFKEQNMDLPLDFVVRPDIAELLLNPEAAFARLAEQDRRLNAGPRRGMFDEDRWARHPQSPHSPRWPENYVDAGPAGGLRPGGGQGMTPRMSPSIRPGITVPPLVPGLISGRPGTPGSPGQYRAVDSERWQRASTGQKGLIPSPQTPLPPVHKAEKRYEVGKSSDEEELKQRQIKGVLNKLTPQNFQKLFEQVKDVKIQSAATLTGVISQIFDKALSEPTFCEMYATFCKQLATDMPEFVEDGEKITFKRVLLNKCQEEFHRGEREEEEVSKSEHDIGAEDLEEKRLKMKRRMLGNIRFIGELYKKHMLTERIMHECICKLLGGAENPEEEDMEALCKLLSTIGHMIDQPARKEHMDAYFKRISWLSDNHQKLSARIRFMLKDLIDLRKNGWQARRKVEGPKKIDEVHRDAAQERQATVAQTGRLSRGLSMGSRKHPPDLNVRVSMVSSFGPSTPMGSASSVKGSQGGLRSPLVQDVRVEDKVLMERSAPMPLSQRSADDGPVTLGPQGGLGRSMSMRNQASGPGVTSVGDVRRFGPGSMAIYSSVGPRGGVDRPSTPPERLIMDRPSSSGGGRVNSVSSKTSRQLDRTSGEMLAASDLNSQHLGSNSRPTIVPPVIHLTEEQLREKSEAILNEYFSARDLKEVIQCVEELRAPKFYPSMVSTWLALSFEKKDLHRELLAKLLISLQKSEAECPILKQEEIVEGFKLVLESLEDFLLDTPKAPEYLAQILVRMISAEALALGQAVDLLRKCELLSSHLSLDMIGKVLFGLGQEKGEIILVEMCQSSGVQVKDFVDTAKLGTKSLSDFLQCYNLQCLRVNLINNVQEVGVEFSKHLGNNESIVEIQRWLETAAAPHIFSDCAFLRMLMTQVLKHVMSGESYEGIQRREILRDKSAHYRTFLKSFALDKDKQWQYIIAMQLYVHDMGHPAGLMTTLFDIFHQLEVISEPAFYKWKDDVNDPTVGRDKALEDVYKWLQWLRKDSE